MAILNNSNAISSGGYDINNSLRFRGSASPTLTRTPASASNQKTWTWSGWVKRGPDSTDRFIFGNSGSLPISGFYFNADNTLRYRNYNGSIEDVQLFTTQVFRDPSAWYHLVVVLDTTQATASNRLKFYINGVQITAFATATYPSLNSDQGINAVTAHEISSYASVVSYFDGYMAEVNFINGQALTPSSFGETDTTTGSWKPKAYTGTYGTNGFYLKFSDIATTSGSNAGLGKDFSGNANYFTTNNISVTAGTTYDAMIDVPTNTSATVANYAVLDPLDPTTSGNMTLSNANLTMTTSAANRSRLSTIYVPSGKWYAEVTFTTASGSLSGCMVGLCRSEDATSVVASYLGSSTNSYGYNQGGDKYNAGSATAYGASYTTSDIIGIAFDADAGTLTFYKNNTSQGTAFTGLSTSSLWSIGVSSGISSASANIVSNINFGQRPFSYTPPTGFVALNTFNLPTPTILQGNKYMDATLYTGNGSTQTITNASSFKPDFVWIKDRTTAYPNMLFDSVRGASKRLISNTTDTEATEADTQTSFNSNGFSVSTNLVVNRTSDAFVGWQWQAGQGSTSSNTSGTITSTVSVNTTAGFSIVTYTGIGSSPKTVGHGLGVAPKMIFLKSRGSAVNWYVWHTSIGATQAIEGLNTTGAASSQITFNNTLPTSSVISLGNNDSNNSGSTYVLYVWAEIAGFSKFTSYTGNGSADGPFVYCGFRPKFVMVKRTDTAGFSWCMKDSSRSPSNEVIADLFANGSDAEYTTAGQLNTDFLSNGFKLRQTNANQNANGGTYIVMAFAENPFKNANAR